MTGSSPEDAGRSACSTSRPDEARSSFSAPCSGGAGSRCGRSRAAVGGLEGGDEARPDHLAEGLVADRRQHDDEGADLAPLHLADQPGLELRRRGEVLVLDVDELARGVDRPAERVGDRAVAVLRPRQGARRVGRPVVGARDLRGDAAGRAERRRPGGSEGERALAVAAPALLEGQRDVARRRALDARMDVVVRDVREVALVVEPVGG